MLAWIFAERLSIDWFLEVEGKTTESIQKKFSFIFKLYTAENPDKIRDTKWILKQILPKFLGPSQITFTCLFQKKVMEYVLKAISQEEVDVREVL